MSLYEQEKDANKASRQQVLTRSEEEKIVEGM